MASKGDRGSHRARPAAGERAPSGDAPNLSRIVKIDDIPEAGLQISVIADPAERAAIAKSAGLIAIPRLEAALDVVKLGEGKFRVSGPLRAAVAQSCVVSLEPFEADIHAEIEADFAAPIRTGISGRRGGAGSREPVDEPSPSFAAKLDAPDPIVAGRIDLGALVEEFLVLNLDPYPRKPGVRFEAAEFAKNPDEKPSPFAALNKLKDAT